AARPALESFPPRRSADLAMAAILVEAGLPGEARDGEALADRFAARTGARPLFAPRGSTEARGSLVADGDTLVHARFEQPSQAEWRARVADQGRRAVSICAGLRSEEHSLNSSHVKISYAVFCLKKKKK